MLSCVDPGITAVWEPYVAGSSLPVVDLGPSQRWSAEQILGSHPQAVSLRGQCFPTSLRRTH